MEVSAGVFDPGTGRIGPAVLKFRLAFLRDASNGVGRFLTILKKRPTPLDASRKKASPNLLTAGPILPVPGSNTPAKVLKPALSVFRIGLLQEMASNHILYRRILQYRTS